MSETLRDTAIPTLILGVAMVTAANILLPLQDALTKDLVLTLPVWEVLFVRGVTVFAATLLIGRRRLATRLVKTPLKRFMAIRGMVMLGGWFAFTLAVRHLPLAQAVTLYFVSPIIVSIVANPLLGEKTPPAQWVAVLIGFCGVALAGGLVGFEASWAVALALLSACLWATSLLMLRSMGKEEGTLVQVSFANLVFVVAMGLPILFHGFAGNTAEILLMMAVGVVGGLGQYAFYEAARHLPVPVLATLEYTAILSAFALGYLMFGEVPTLTIWIGAVLVLVSGVLVVLVERVRLMAAPLARELPVPPTLSDIIEENEMTDATHDKVVKYIAGTRFPFAGQTTWPDDYITLTNVPEKSHAVPTPAGDHYPDIAIVNTKGELREAGEVEMTVDPASVPYFKAVSESVDDLTPTKVRHFFVYVPAGSEAAMQKLLEDNGISYAGVRGFAIEADGSCKVVPFVTKGDPYDDQVTVAPAA